MAKNKDILTPEELEAKKIRKSNGWTRFWAIIVAFALTLGVFSIAKSNGEKLAAEVESETTGVADSSNSAANANSSSGWDSGSSDQGNANANAGDANANAGDANANAGDANANANANASSSTGAMDEAAVANLINTATGKAVSSKAGYDWERHCTVNDIDVGSATNVLNKIIHGVDENADLNSVVGGFLGRGDRNVKVPKGKTLAELTEEKDDGTTKPYYHGDSYTLKATKLQAGDIKNLKINGDTYTFDIPDTVNPGRDDATPLSRFTNDIVVKDEVNKEIQEQVGSAVTVNTLDAKYTNIKVSVTIKDGKLVELTYSFRGDAALGIKAAVVNINGTGNLIVNAKYSNFVY